MQASATERATETVYFEAAVRPRSDISVFEEPSAIQTASLDELAPPVGRATRAAIEFQRLGLTIRHVGKYSISGECSRSLWEETFHTRVARRTRNLYDTETGEPSRDRAAISYLSHVADEPFTIPDSLSPLVERAYPQTPPQFLGAPLPPQPSYFHLRVPDDVALILRASGAHEHGVTGRGVLVAMTDTGFYKHPFYEWHGYNYNVTLAPDAMHMEQDENGHGTAEAANIFAAARDVDFVGVKMGGNATLAFKTAADLYPAVMTNSWGYHLPDTTTLPNFLKPLEIAVEDAVRNRGITVCFSGGNGQVAFPAMMPEVIAVGGVYAQATLQGADLDLMASDYASSFDSLVYPGRHVPDVCGLVGQQPKGIYIMLPVQPGCEIDAGLAGGTFPTGDQTTPSDGWAAISGTSAASPQIAGVCALLKQVQPGLSPELVKAVLKSSARDVQKGSSHMGQPAGPGHDGATGAGVVDASAACAMARSITPRDLSTVPPPR
ncbi:subtilisin family serine protease [Lipingzhangella halophila]|uniref:Subtilisin family serine protease n=1 Tax=Lipingzhangella halophila TaxID=1783352 RepID=A0A7W7RLP0_9ACTN|nr:S8 family serine peptidase [Lipingzhangella halophila]MBB4933761.1 subtilisin family serine protease [Lipingzhangella halophila]